MNDLKQTPLYDLHLELGAKMVPFAGYSMPVQYPSGVMTEHKHTRAYSGLFDVSHMGQIIVEGPDWDSVALGFETLVPQNVLGLADHRQRYGFFTNNAGGIEDDLMFARRGSQLFVVVNAACKDADFDRMKAALEPELSVTALQDRSLIAVQGPGSENMLMQVGLDVSAMAFMDFAELTWQDETLFVSRSGYTGEDGFEISVPSGSAEKLARQILDQDEALPIGLGARDSLRLEAGLCLYGHDIDASTTPVEAGLVWAIQKARRAGGERAGGFPGAEIILNQIASGAGRRRIGLQPEGRAPMREGVEIFGAIEGGDPIGCVTSGGFGPTVEGPVAMGYAPSETQSGDVLYGSVRGKMLPVQAVDLPFVKPGFKR